MRRTGTFIVQHWLLWLGLIINILFYVSAAKTKWFNYFFSGSVLHLCCRGLDFYQIPNGAYSYFHGGSLSVTDTTTKVIYGIGFPAGNPNVYHPFFTVLLGGFLILFSPANSFYVWMFVKLILTLFLVIYFYISFKDCKFVQFALFVTLINSTQYIEIEISQFQFALNFFFFLFLIGLVKHEKSGLNGFYYFFSLIAKPVGLLWIPVLLFKRKFRPLFVGLGWFVFATLVFVIAQKGTYYTDNLLGNFLSPDTSGPIQIITLGALLRYSTHLSPLLLSGIKMLALLLVVCLSVFKRISLLMGIFLSVVYYLLFYDLVFEYHYTTMIPILAVCLVACPEFQTLPARILATIISLPNVFFVLHFFHFAMKDDSFLGPDPTFLGWQLIVLSRIVPIILLTAFVLKPHVKPLYQDAKTFLLVIREVNKKVEVLG